MRELLLYVHVPFCSSKCHFCTWVAQIPAKKLVRSQASYEAYVEAVEQQIKFQAAALGSNSVSQVVYFGGGTPTILEPRQLGRLLDLLNKCFRRGSSYKDATVEASPETVTLEKLRGLREAGFDRISLGVQSFNDARLRAIGRSHTSSDAVRAVKDARRAQFGNLNLDLILGFPDQTDAEWKETLERALSLEPDHISVYLFRRSPGTVMSRRSQPPAFDVFVERYLKTQEALARRGYEEYLFQLFGKSGRRCYADLAYFNLEMDYLGFGAGAHSLVNGQFFGHHVDLDRYLARPFLPGYAGPARQARSAITTKVFEMLHTRNGLNFERFSQRLHTTISLALGSDARLEGIFKSVRQAGATEDAAGIRFESFREQARWFASYS